MENGHFSWVRSYRYCYASCERLRCFSETAIKDMVECLQYASMGIGQFDSMYKERDTSCTINCAFLQVQPMFISSVSLEVCKKIYSRVHCTFSCAHIQSNPIMYTCVNIVHILLYTNIQVYANYHVCLCCTCMNLQLCEEIHWRGLMWRGSEED